MSGISQIKKPIASEMEAFETKFKASMASRVPLLDKITHYIIRRKGKQLRPMFVFLSAKMLGEINESTYLGASLIELMHTATLVHDDVVDDANKRRGFFSINALWKNKIAVLVGDFLLSKVLLLSVKHEEYGLLKLISSAVEQMSEGELLQIEKARKLDITEDIYYEIIFQKTASLIATCCAVGAHSVGVKDDVTQKMYDFGRNIGMAFQIKDDLFDFQKSSKIGKPTGIDIKEQKMTLPLIHALQKASQKEKRHIINLIKNHHTNPKKVEEVVNFVVNGPGIKYAEDKMMTFVSKGKEILSDFPDNESKKSLISLTDYVISRTK